MLSYKHVKIQIYRSMESSVECRFTGLWKGSVEYEFTGLKKFCRVVDFGNWRIL